MIRPRSWIASTAGMTDAELGWIGFDAARGRDSTVLVQITADSTRAIAMLGDAIATTDRAMRAFARSHGYAFTWRARIADYQLHGRTRPDGRPRRSGHRHRGTAAWARRHG